MKVTYRGYEIDVHRGRALGGWDNLYYAVFRVSDGYECASGFTTGSDKVRDFIGYFKRDIDRALAGDEDLKDWVKA